MRKILVTPRSITKSGHKSLDRLRDVDYEVVFCTPGLQPTENELINILPRCIGYLAGVEKISSQVLEAAKNLKVISRNGVGVDNIDLSAAKRLNIVVCRTGAANARGVAELTVSLLMSLVRSIVFCCEQLKTGRWERRVGMEIKGKTLGVIGCGRIGKEVACLALSLGMKVIAYDPFINDFFTPSESFEYVQLEKLLQESDVISLHIPATDAGKPLVDRGFLKRVKKGVFLINTARGLLVDDDAMIEALDHGIVEGFATDVFRQEPPHDIRLSKHNKVISTPHIGGFTVESIDRAMNEAVSNILNVLNN